VSLFNIVSGEYPEFPFRVERLFENKFGIRRSPFRGNLRHAMQNDPNIILWVKKSICLWIPEKITFKLLCHCLAKHSFNLEILGKQIVELVWSIFLNMEGIFWDSIFWFGNQCIWSGEKKQAIQS
jgi:hypothetical protein